MKAHPQSSRGQWRLLQLTRRLWFRPALFSALAAVSLSPYIPADLAKRMGAHAVDDILNTLAASMLAVTIFSLSTMVSAYAAATGSVTPRATKLLLEDRFTQNALATFLGAFLFSLVGITALSTGLYGNEGRAVLFLVTLGVVVLIIATLLRWIDHVSRLGRVGETTDLVEAAAREAMEERRDQPHLGAMPLLDPHGGVPPDARPLYSREIGYVQHIDLGALQELAREHGGAVYVHTLPGGFVETSRPLAWVRGIQDDRALNAAARSFIIGGTRSFDQDPRFGLSVLAEIASRSLSSAINDPGTAIEVIGRAVRLLTIWADTPATAGRPVLYPDLHVPGIELSDLFDDVFGPIARDGASNVDVGVRLQKALTALARLDDPRYAVAARRHSALALERAVLALQVEHDRGLIRDLARRIDTAPDDPRKR